MNINEVLKLEEEEESIINDPLINKKIFNRYKILKHIGKGSFGKIYLSKEIYTNEYYAMKVENKNTHPNYLKNEAELLLYLNCPKTPAIKTFGYTIDYNILIMELLGKSLDYIFENILLKKPMSLRCVCNLGYQLIEILEFIHKKNVIHRDIKPDNLLMSNKNNKFLYLLDFGLAIKFRESTNSRHFPMKIEKKLIGTVRYASVNALNGITQSRRDDLESVGYVLLYFLKGKLPWQGLMIKNKEKRYQKIMEIKRDIKMVDLCKGCPEEFQKYIDYVRNLQYEEDPDYCILKGLFINILKKNEFKFDYFYDWDIKNTNIDLNSLKNEKQRNTFNNCKRLNIVNNKKQNNINKKLEIFEEENNLDLPLDKISYRNKTNKGNKSQDKSTGDGYIEYSEDINNYNNRDENFIQNRCCLIF